MRWLNWISLLLPLTYVEADCERVFASMLVQDPKTACLEAERLISENPHSQEVWKAYIQALGKNGDEKGMIAAWKQYITFFPDESANRALLEEMAWSTIEKASLSSSPPIRMYALLGAFFGQDARGVKLIHKHLSDESANMRLIAVKLSSELQDSKLKETVFSLLKTESNWKVRLEVIKAVGKMKIQDAQAELISIVGNDRTLAEEKAAAIEALLHLIETPDRNEVSLLTKSNRAGLRLLACEMIAHAELKNELDLVIPLLQDHCNDVRAAAINTLGICRAINPHLIAPLLQDKNSKVAIYAAWAMTIEDPQKGIEAFRPWLQNDQKETKLLATAALSATGKYGLPLMQEVFKQTDDPYVKINLALGLIGQRSEVEEASHALYEGFISSEKWMWDESNGFKVLAPNKVKHSDMTPNYPEAINQLTHLEILNILAVLQNPHVKEAVKHFLKMKTWGITGMASALLLTEGDEESIEVVKTLLDDPTHDIRVQAAMVLAGWGREEPVISILEEAYKDSPRDIKERILEGVGRVGSLKSIPFLVERLDESSQSLRIIAASSLLQTLYH